MSCDLSDPAIAPAYEEVATGQGANWLILGYHDSRDTISLYTKGAGGLEEFRAHLTDEVLYGYLNFESNLIFVTYISESVSGIRRARAFVHGKHVATMLNKHDVYFTASSLADLTESNVHARIRPKSVEIPDIAESQPPVGDIENPTQEIPEPEAVPKIETSPDTEVVPISAPTTELPPIPAPRPADEVETEEVEEEFVSPVEATTPDHQLESPADTVHEVAEESESIHETVNSNQSTVPNGTTIPEELTKDPKSLETDRILEENLKKREDLMNQVLESESSGNATSLTGFITVQGGGVYFWKRRWFALRGNTLYLYRDGKDKYPLSSIDFGVGISRIEDARSEVLIPNSFRVEFSPNEVYHFFADTSEEKAQIMGRFLSCVTTH